MTSDLTNKIEAMARRLRFKQSKDHKIQGPAILTYESIIAFNIDYPKNLFLVNKNMHFGKGLETTSYDIYRFDGNGKHKEVEDFDRQFLNKLKVIKTII
jgi:hypothetical protein